MKQNKIGVNRKLVKSGYTINEKPIRNEQLNQYIMNAGEIKNGQSSIFRKNDFNNLKHANQGQATNQAQSKIRTKSARQNSTNMRIRTLK